MTEQVDNEQVWPDVDARGGDVPRGAKAARERRAGAGTPGAPAPRMPADERAGAEEDGHAQIVLRDVHVRYPAPAGTPEAGAEATGAVATANTAEMGAPNAGPAPEQPDLEPTEALAGITLSIRAGEHVCILGANGSGKSTLVQLINGLIVPTAGSVEVFGIGTGTPEGAAAIRRRAAMVFQHPEDQMVTSIVADDVAFGPENLGVPSAQIAQRVDSALEAVDMATCAQADPADLSGGQQQRVAIAGALAMDPQILLLDEPAAMLDAAGRRAIQTIVQRLNRRGITIVHVTHFMDDALAADRVIVLERGRIALDGTPAEVFAERETVHRLGLELPFAEELAWTLERAVPELGPLPRTARSEELARVLASRLAGDRWSSASPCDTAGLERVVQPDGACRPADEAAISFLDVSFSYADERPARTRRRFWQRRQKRTAPAGPLAVEHLTFDVPRGSLTALVGRTGSGKSTTVELACALKLPRTGTVRVGGIATDDLSRRRKLRAQVGYVSQLPDRQLFAETVFDDVAFGPRNLGLTEDEVQERVHEALELTGIAPTPELLRRSPFALSGGQQRSVALAGVLALKTPLLILDEPMAGLDPQGRTRMHTLIGRLRERGVTILMVTHSMDDVAELADRVLVLADGALVADGTPRTVFGARGARVDAPEAATAGQSASNVGTANASTVPGSPSRSARPAALRAPAPGLPEALTFARKLESAGVRLPYEPLTRHELVELIGQLARLGTTRDNSGPIKHAHTQQLELSPDPATGAACSTCNTALTDPDYEEVRHGAAR